MAYLARLILVLYVSPPAGGSTPLSSSMPDTLSAMFAVVFEYQVDPEQIAPFEATYGPHGGWARMFQPAPGYLGTDLLRHESAPGTYILVDRWESAAAYDRFLRAAGERYTAFSESSRTLYRSERSLGRFATV